MDLSSLRAHCQQLENAIRGKERELEKQTRALDLAYSETATASAAKQAAEGHARACEEVAAQLRTKVCI